ncbi:MAG: DUF1343 domain-containing protein [Candidatus Sumerlaeia bacterium]|nr:DUF1343 domain-containing protein [Candidatus Sumerlaeia bacterium]
MFKKTAASMVAGLALILGTVAMPTTAASQPSTGTPLDVENPRVRPGVEVLMRHTDHLDHVRGKRVGLITNATGVDSKLISTIDLFHDHPDIDLVALFGPEHGVRGEAAAGIRIDDYVDESTGVPVYSLYGATRRPRQEWLADLDVLVYDIQDVGSSSYTYIYTMAHSMEEAGKADIPFVVLDRPNPVGADYVDGPVLNVMEESDVRSFIGYYDIAYMYGMTPGETAKMFNEHYNEEKVELHVVPMEGYERWMRQWDTGLPFVPTSTHIPDAKHAFYYSLTGIVGEIRGGINIGVGYPNPFETFAAPWIDRDELTDAIRARNIPGLMVRPISYRPFYAAFSGQDINGVHLVISNYRTIRPVTAQIHMMEIIQDLYGEHKLFENVSPGSGFHKALGTRKVREMLLEGKSADEIIASFQPRLEEFKKIREQHLIYE